MDDITLRAFEKYRALKILQKYLRETFSQIFRHRTRALAKYLAYTLVKDMISNARYF